MAEEEMKPKVFSASEYFGQNNIQPKPQDRTTIKTQVQKTSDVENMSGKGAGYKVPDVVSKRFNWGAFLLTWIWGLGNRTYITLVSLLSGLVCLIPFVGIFVVIGLQIWFGIKGNEWAWQHKQFSSVEAFHQYQKKWAIAAVIVLIINMVVIPAIILTKFLPLLSSFMNI